MVRNGAGDWAVSPQTQKDKKAVWWNWEGMDSHSDGGCIDDVEIP